MTFRQCAMDNRHKLLLSLIYANKNRGAGPAETGYEIGLNAKRMGLVDSVKEIKGTTLESWIKTKKIPAWAARSAADLLLQDPNYSPQDDRELDSLILMLVEGSKLEDINQLKTLLDDRFDVSETLLIEALQSKNKGA